MSGLGLYSLAAFGISSVINSFTAGLLNLRPRLSVWVLSLGLGFCSVWMEEPRFANFAKEYLKIV